MRKKWAKPTLYLLDRDFVKNGNRNGFNESTIFSVGATSDNGNTTFYFKTVANQIHSQVNKGNPIDYFS